MESTCLPSCDPDLTRRLAFLKSPVKHGLSTHSFHLLPQIPVLRGCEHGSPRNLCLENSRLNLYHSETVIKGCIISKLGWLLMQPYEGRDPFDCHTTGHARPSHILRSSALRFTSPGYTFPLDLFQRSIS